MTAHMAPSLMHMKDDQSGILRKLAVQRENKQKIKTKDLHITEKWDWQKTETRIKRRKNR